MKEIDQSTRRLPTHTSRIHVLTFRVLCFTGFLLLIMPQSYIAMSIWLSSLLFLLSVVFISNLLLIKFRQGQSMPDAVRFDQQDHAPSTRVNFMRAKK